MRYPIIFEVKIRLPGRVVVVDAIYVNRELIDNRQVGNITNGKIKNLLVVFSEQGTPGKVLFSPPLEINLR